MLVTIGIPTVVRFAYLQEAVRSALGQVHADIEVLISDDGSDTRIREWSEELAQCDSRIRYQRTTGRVGLAGNWNAIGSSARGELTAIIGDDDRLLPTFVSSLLALTPGCEVTFGNVFLIDANGERLINESSRHTQSYGRDRLAVGLLQEPAAIVWRNSVPMSGSLIRTACLRALPFKEDLNTPEIEFFARLVAAGGRFSFSGEYVSEYRVHSASETARGLNFAKLAMALEAVPVPEQLVTLKRMTVEGLLEGAVGALLHRGEVKAAKDLVRHHLYPSWTTSRPRVLAQVLCASLPPPLGRKLYLALRALSRQRNARERTSTRGLTERA